MRRRRHLALTVSLLAAAVTIAMGTTSSSAGATGAGKVGSIKHVFVIMMENTGSDSLLGNPNAPWINQVVQTYGVAGNYYGITHPSQPNYIAATSGSTNGVADDNDTTIDVPNIVDQLESKGHSWKAYMQSYSLCSTPLDHACGNQLYERKHNPFISYQDVQSDPARVAKIVDLYTGGAHCCWFTLFLRWDGRTYRSTQHLWGDPSYDLTDLDHDGRPELVSADDRFAYAFTSYAASALPIQIWRYDRGTLTDVTPSYPALVRKDAASLWTDYLQTRNQNGADERGLLAAWLADEYRLGLAKDGWGKIRAAYARGELSAPRVDPLWPAGQKYVTALRIFLAKNGY